MWCFSATCYTFLSIPAVVLIPVSNTYDNMYGLVLKGEACCCLAGLWDFLLPFSISSASSNSGPQTTRGRTEEPNGNTPTMAWTEYLLLPETNNTFDLDFFYWVYCSTDHSWGNLPIMIWILFVQLAAFDRFLHATTYVMMRETCRRDAVNSTTK